LLAWAVAITELAGGLCLLLGLLTRLAAFGIAGVMLGAMWLTQIGPAIQSGKTTLGFLPDYGAFDGMKWEPLMFQFALCAAALALAFLGPGRLSLDTALLSGRGGDDDED
jgi:putative oxidoreductase